MDLSEIKRKIVDFHSAPTYWEVAYLIRNISHNEWLKFCQENNKYLIETQEFVSGLSLLLESLPRPIVEVCAGTGKLSNLLESRGIPIIPTDDYSWRFPRSPKVIKLDISEALETYRPRTVVGSWIPSNFALGKTILEYPDVAYFIDISEGIGAHSSWTSGLTFADLKRIAKSFGYKFVVMGELSRLSFSIESRVENGVIHNKSLVILFYRKSLEKPPQLYRFT